MTTDESDFDFTRLRDLDRRRETDPAVIDRIRAAAMEGFDRNVGRDASVVEFESHRPIAVDQNVRPEHRSRRVVAVAAAALLVVAGIGAIVQLSDGPSSTSSSGNTEGLSDEVAVASLCSVISDDVRVVGRILADPGSDPGDAVAPLMAIADRFSSTASELEGEAWVRATAAGIALREEVAELDRRVGGPPGDVSRAEVSAFADRLASAVGALPGASSACDVETLRAG